MKCRWMTPRVRQLRQVTIEVSGKRNNGAAGNYTIVRTFYCDGDAGNSFCPQTITVKTPRHRSSPSSRHYTVECSDEMPMDDAGV